MDPSVPPPISNQASEQTEQDTSPTGPLPPSDSHPTMELVAPAAANLTFKLLTHNMWCHYLTAAPNKAHRMHSFMHEIGKHDYDVILLQELFIINVLGLVTGDDLRNYMTTEFTKLGYEHQAISTPPPWFFGQTSGLLMFSKHPISTFEERRWYRIDDFGTGKGYMRALLQIHGKQVHLFNVHLDAHGAAARKDQLKALVNDLPKPYSANHVVIAGDYNIDYNNTDEYNSMMELFTPREFRDIFADAIAPTHQRGSVIDHILATVSLPVAEKRVEKFVDANGAPISDHYGLSAVFVLN
eukprot:Phypoly_transcript_13780.p1 GENE.Phypoly_transcript_13780~~Phypoly_transcript_13780.p1  ORF type:complete len:312 (+),score=47.96 Phypoly_transcript_13780:43-936(+)